jgi:hypothetical protein
MSRLTESLTDITVFLQEDSNHKQFETSRQKEITGLIEKGVFKITNPQDVPAGVRIFNSRFVDEIKNPGTDKAFEKSRLVVQAYNDLEKGIVLTQSPTICCFHPILHHIHHVIVSRDSVVFNLYSNLQLR